jgi:cell division septum initiation protein DivIVA
MNREVMAQRVLDTFSAMHDLDVRIAAFKRNAKIERDQLRADIAALEEELNSIQMRLDDQEGE